MIVSRQRVPPSSILLRLKRVLQEFMVPLGTAYLLASKYVSHFVLLYLLSTSLSRESLRISG